MPTYSFKCLETGEIKEEFLSISQLSDFKAANPQLQQVHTSSPKLVTGVNKKPDDGFRDVLKSIKKASGRNNTVNTF